MERLLLVGLILGTLAWAASPLGPDWRSIFAPPMATVEVLVVPEAGLYVDGTFLGSANKHSLRLEPGQHLLRLKAEGYQDHAATIVLDRGEMFTLLEELVPEPVPEPPPPLEPIDQDPPKSPLE